MGWLDALPNNRRPGSFPRCLFLMEGGRTIVADKLADLVGMPDVHVEAKHFWMPQGLPVTANDRWDMTPIEEAKLGESIGFLSEDHRKEVTNW